VCVCEQAPIGIIKSLIVCKQRGQVITSNSGSTHIHVWNRLARRAVQVQQLPLIFFSALY
jgi:hypothetical protein